MTQLSAPVNAKFEDPLGNFFRWLCLLPFFILPLQLSVCITPFLSFLLACDYSKYFSRQVRAEQRRSAHLQTWLQPVLITNSLTLWELKRYEILFQLKIAVTAWKTYQNCSPRVLNIKVSALQIRIMSLTCKVC